MAVSQPFVCDLLEMQPGQPGGADWYFENCFEEQPLKFQMRVEGYGFILFFDGREDCVTDRNFNRQSMVSYTGNCLVKNGKDSFSFGCTFGGEEGPEVSVRVITQGAPYQITR